MHCDPMSFSLKKMYSSYDSSSRFLDGSFFQWLISTVQIEVHWSIKKNTMGCTNFCIPPISLPPLLPVFDLILFSAAEEVGDSEQPGVGRVPVLVVGELLGEAVLPATADAGTEFRPPMDVIMATQSGTTTSGLCQCAQEGGENLTMLQNLAISFTAFIIC